MAHRRHTADMKTHRRRQGRARPPDHTVPLPRRGEFDPDDPRQDTYDVEMRRRLLAEISATAPDVPRRLRYEVLKAKDTRAALAAFLDFFGLAESLIAPDLRETVGWWKRRPDEARRKHLRLLWPFISLEVERPRDAYQAVRHCEPPRPGARGPRTQCEG